ncbi:hypothetical protein LCL89_09315 [Halobacillus yeomjeoni]|uniref:hypothetical protein n=1 Tax=Halobacillus yeomjeoni TaxID=311194 RepID=UPI001CD7AC29|nr:hypothetical protein [Halobacillus yeomjeoni]MCA0984242.1 hypothetical protein [Halobacillus yeomjeoni]
MVRLLNKGKEKKEGIKVKHIIAFVLIAFVLSACGQIAEKGSGEAADISLEEVENAISEQGLVLEGADLPDDNLFIQTLNGISPEVYSIEGSELTIYVFPSAASRELGMEDFKERTATAQVVTHKAYTIKNILAFYVQGDKQTYSKLNTAIRDL